MKEWEYHTKDAFTDASVEIVSDYNYNTLASVCLTECRAMRTYPLLT